MTDKNYYTIIELAAEINRSRKTVWQWIALGKLHSERCGIEHRISKADWEAAHARFNAKTRSGRPRKDKDAVLQN